MYEYCLRTLDKEPNIATAFWMTFPLRFDSDAYIASSRNPKETISSYIVDILSIHETGVTGCKSQGPLGSEFAAFDTDDLAPRSCQDLEFVHISFFSTSGIPTNLHLLPIDSFFSLTHNCYLHSAR